MNKKIGISLLVGLMTVTSVAAVAGSLSWFAPTAIIGNDKNPLDGSTLGAYFAYGNGTPTSEEHPNDNVYGITSPRHLYNLAWLQYLGFFNKTEANGGKQFYFELADNIDMTGWVLPPIGTETKPFIGNFNGNGYVVSNLTISNKFSDFDKHPSDVNASNFTAPHIIGFFGVIGDYNNEWDGTYYSSAANNFTNTGLTGITIHTYLYNSLMGVAAGYVSGGMSNIAVDASTLNIDNSISETTTSFGGHTTNISDFSLVGYTTHTKNVKKIDETIYDVNIDSGIEFNGQDQGEGETGWGGSIDMMSVTNRLRTIRDTTSLITTTTFSYYREYTKHEDDTTDTLTTERVGNTSSNDTPVIINSNDEIGHFQFMKSANSSNSTTINQRYALLGGGHWEKHNYYTYNGHTNGRFITDGTNYLTYNGSLTNYTDSTRASIWTFTQTNNYYTISTVYNGTTYYLYYNNGALGISTTGTGSTRRWQVDDTLARRDIKYNGDTNYHLTYSGGWTLVNTSGTGYYLIHDNNGHYVGPTSNYKATSVDSSSAVHFLYSTSGHGYYNSSQTSYYLGYYSSTYPVQLYSDDRAYFRLADASTGNIQSELYGTGVLRATNKNADTVYSSGTYYVGWSNNAWTAVTSIGSAAQMTIEYIDPTAFVANLEKTSNVTGTHYGPDESLNNSLTTSKMVYSEHDVTYFPLSTINNTSDFRPADNNTAYVIGGSGLTESTTQYKDELSNVRFGYYPISSSFTSGDFTSNTGTFNKVYTVNDSMSQELISNESAYEKFADAKKNLGSVMKNQTNVYGLHFMESTISMDVIMTAPYVKVNKQVHENYQLPVNCIDFHLKEFGYINFMAGSYYSTTVNNQTKRNNSFFALYQIERNDDEYQTINRILEVKNVYQHSTKTKSYSYVYELTDGTSTFYTKPYKVIDAEGHKEWLYDTEHDWEENQYVTSKPANYNLVFKVDRIKVNTIDSGTFDKHIYYFEIPMNDGEFCLGSASGGIGSYLMYLDIGANASKYQRTTFFEKFSITEKNYLRPDGVALIELPTTFTKETPVLVISEELDYEDSACVKVIAGAKQTYEIDRAGNDVTLTRANQSNAPPVYAGETVTIHEKNSSTPIEPTYISSTTKLFKRMTYYDVNVNLGALMITQITDVSTDGGSTYTRAKIVQKIYAGTDDTATPTAVYTYDPSESKDERSSMKVFADNGVKITDNNMINVSSLVINNNKLSSDDIITVRIIQQGNQGYTEDIVIHAIVDNNNLNGTYYLYNSYRISITTADGTVTVKVVSIDSGAVIYYGETQATTVGQVITITA